MARVKLAAEDQFLVWAATAPVGEVEAQYRRVGAVLAQRRAGTKVTRKRAAKANGLDTKLPALDGAGETRRQVFMTEKTA